MLETMPREAELREWLWHVLSLWLPHRQICDGHVSAYKYFTDRYYDKILDTILWAARLWGKSMLAGLECWMKGRDMAVPFWQANICAGSGAQAARVYEATDLFWMRTDDIGGRAVLAKEPLKSRTEFIDGSMYEITTSSTTAQRGPHPNQLIADEIDQMARDVFHSAMNQTMDKYGHKASTALLSTMHKVGGLMSEWVDNADIRGYKLYVSCILETLEACTGDYSCESCNLERYCQRRLKQVTAEEEAIQQEAGIIKPGEKPYLGFNTIEGIRRKVQQGTEREEGTGRVRVLDVDAELFCRRPSRTGLVFPDFSETFHIVPAQDIRIQTEWVKARCGDWGFSAPFVDLHFAITPRDQIIFYKEFVQPGMTMPEIITHYKQDRLHTAFRHTFQDPAGATEIETCKRAGVRMEGVTREIQEGIRAITHLLRQRVDGQPMFIVSSDCPILISEIVKWSYPDNKETENPVKKDDHCIEAASRGVIGWLRGRLGSIGELLKGVKVQKDRRREIDRTDELMASKESAIRRTGEGRKIKRGKRRSRPGGVSEYL